MFGGGRKADGGGRAAGFAAPPSSKCRVAHLPDGLWAGNVRISGPTPSVGYVGSTDAYRVTYIVEKFPGFQEVLNTYAVLSDPDKGIAYAFVHIRPHPLQLAPGEKVEVEITLVDPCNDNVKADYPVDGNCGAWNPSIDMSELRGTSLVTLVADRHPEQTVTRVPRYATRPSAS